MLKMKSHDYTSRLQITIWVIAGTLDGRKFQAVEIQNELVEDVLVTVVSQYGAELAAHKGITAFIRTSDQEAMQKNLIKKHNVRY